MIDYEEDSLIPLLFRSEGSVAPRALIFAVPATIITVVLLYAEEWAPGIHADLGIPDLNSSWLWNATTGVLLLLLAFRTKTAFSRFWEGTGLLHQMRGEWFDTVSNCVTFSISAKANKPDAVNRFRHTLVRLMSLCHGSALEEIAGDSVTLASIDRKGLDSGTLNHIQKCNVLYCFNKVEIMLHLVQSLITKAHDDQILKIPPPILSRVYQTISRGFVNLLNAKKITDTRFPFPYAQTITVLLFLNTILTPMMISQSVRSKVLAAIFTFIPIFGMYAINFVAGELENPFGTDINDLPLEIFQEEMNSCLLMLLHPNADLISSISPRCISDFNELIQAMGIGADDDAPSPELRRLSQWGRDFIPSGQPQRLRGTESESLKRLRGTESESLKIAEQNSELDPRNRSPLASECEWLSELDSRGSPSLGVIPIKEAPQLMPLSPPEPLSAPPAPVFAAPQLSEQLSRPLVAEASPTSSAKKGRLALLRGLRSGEVSKIVEDMEATQRDLNQATQRLKEDEAPRLKEEEAARLEELQREVEQRINEFYLALQRWTLMMESQVKQIREMLEILRLLSTAVFAKSEGWEGAMHPI